jgi:hypothetical protein
MFQEELTAINDINEDLKTKDGQIKELERKVRLKTHFLVSNKINFYHKKLDELITTVPLILKKVEIVASAVQKLTVSLF